MKQLTKVDRQQIQYHLSCGYNACQIGKMLGRNRSTITREIKRNSVKGEYRADKANHKAYQRRYWVLTEPQKIRAHPELESFIEAKLKLRKPWSPETIAEVWNKTEAIKATVGYTISAPTIYQYLYGFRPGLCQYLCFKRARKKKRVAKPKRTMISNRTPIEDRPAIIESRILQSSPQAVLPQKN